MALQEHETATTEMMSLDHLEVQCCHFHARQLKMDVPLLACFYQSECDTENTGLWYSWYCPGSGLQHQEWYMTHGIVR